MEDLAKILEFFHLIGRLKTTYRFKSNNNFIGDSSADHSWRLALMTYILARKLELQVDILKSMKIALIHDLAESITGDIDARLIREKVYSKEQKKKMEEDAMVKIRETLSGSLGEEINALWEEYEAGSTPEALYIKILDKVETSMHIVELGRGAFENEEELIGTYGNENVEKFPELKEFFQLVKEELKQEFKKGGFSWKEEYDVN